MRNSELSMQRAISPIGLYSAGVFSLITKELKTYAEEFDRLSERIDDILTECFVDTAFGEGLAWYEEQYGPVRTDCLTDDRRAMIRTLLSVGENDFTPQGVERFFRSIGFECEITEYPQFYELYILPEQRIYTRAEQDLIIARAKAFLPCHLNVHIEFRTADWDDYGDLELSFDEWDDLSMTWDKLDRYEGE